MTSAWAPWRLLRRRPDLARLLGAGLVSLTGDWLLAVGLSYAVYDLTGSTMASAAVLVVSLVPQVLVGLVAGVLVDRWDRRRTMIVANLLMAAALLPLLLVNGADRIWVGLPGAGPARGRRDVLRASRAGDAARGSWTRPTPPS